jgi:hypothetical protein
VYIGKLETRLERVEGQLTDCYQLNKGRDLSDENVTFNPQLAILTDNKSKRWKRKS